MSNEFSSLVQQLFTSSRANNPHVLRFRLRQALHRSRKITFGLFASQLPEFHGHVVAARSQQTAFGRIPTDGVHVLVMGVRHLAKQVVGGLAAVTR